MALQKSLELKNANVWNWVNHTRRGHYEWKEYGGEVGAGSEVRFIEVGFAWRKIEVNILCKIARLTAHFVCGLIC